jgi:hypothetical protein
MSRPKKHPEDQKTIRFTMDLPEDLGKAIKHLAVEKNLTASDIIRMALKDEFDQNKLTK